MINQRAFMSALLHRAASPAVLLNPLRWYPMVHAAGGAWRSTRAHHVWDLARLAWALRGDVTTTTVPIGEFTGSDSGAVVVWDSEAASRLFDAHWHGRADARRHHRHAAVSSVRRRLQQTVPHAS